MSSSNAKYTPPKPSPLPPDADEFIATLSEKERELMKMGQEMLGSSFFLQWTHAYKKWKAANGISK